MNCSKPDGIVDMSSGYGLGMDFLKAGKREEDDKSLYVLAGGDWDPLYARLRMAYVIGHKNEIRSIASKAGLDPAHLTHAVYIAGVKFRDLKSSDAYKKITGVAPYPYNILHNNSFEEAAKTIADYQLSIIDADKREKKPTRIKVA